MNRTELRQTLHVSDAKLSEWIKAGLPRSRPTPGGAFEYDPQAVSTWLIESGRASQPQVVNSIEDVARHFQRTTRRVRQWAAEGMPGGTAGPWDLDAIAEWRTERRGVTGADPLLSGPSSPALERYRAAKAGLAELELAERRQELLPREAIHGFLASYAAIIRRAGEQLGRAFGTDAQGILTSALKDGESLINRWLESVNAGRGCPTCCRPYCDECADCLTQKTLGEVQP